MKKPCILGLVLALILGYLGYRIGFSSAVKQMNDNYIASPENAYFLLADKLGQMEDKDIFSYFVRGEVAGLGMFSSDETISKIENQDLKDLLKKHQLYLKGLMEQRKRLIEKNPELSLEKK